MAACSRCDFSIAVACAEDVAQAMKGVAPAMPTGCTVRCGVEALLNVTEGIEVVRIWVVAAAAAARAGEDGRAAAGVCILDGTVALSIVTVVVGVAARAVLGARATDSTGGGSTGKALVVADMSVVEGAPPTGAATELGIGVKRPDCCTGCTACNGFASMRHDPGDIGSDVTDASPQTFATCPPAEGVELLRLRTVPNESEGACNRATEPALRVLMGCGDAGEDGTEPGRGGAGFA